MLLKMLCRVLIVDELQPKFSVQDQLVENTRATLSLTIWLYMSVNVELLKLAPS